MEEIRLTTKDDKYPIIYRVFGPSQVVSRISSINSILRREHDYGPRW